MQAKVSTIPRGLDPTKLNYANTRWLSLGVSVGSV